MTSTQRWQAERSIERTRRSIQTARLLGNFPKVQELRRRLGMEQRNLRQAG